MKRILCFGDSNTYGYDAFVDGRFGSDVRWAGLLGTALAGQATVLEEGKNNRTCNFDDPKHDGINGLTILPALLERHWPLDGVVIMLGTNDCKNRYHATASIITAQMERLIDTVRSFAAAHGQPEIPMLLISPVPLNTDSSYYDGFPISAQKLSQELASHYRVLAQSKGIAFADAGAWGVALDFDGTHLTREGHRTFFRNAEPLVRQVFNL